jgi:hypothetical protein
VTAPTYDKTLPAVRFVKRHAMDEADEQWLKEVLGLVRPDGSLAPDDNNVYTFNTDHSGKAPGTKGPSPTKPGRDRSAVPDGLRHLQPVEDQPKPKPRKARAKVVRPKKARQLKPCGTYAAYSRHRREGKTLEELRVSDPDCYEACLAYGRDRKADERAAAKKLRKQAEHKRLTDAGVNLESARVLADAVA